MKTETGIGLCKDDTAFDRWKRNLSVPKKANAFSPLCEQYVKQREYRQKKEKYEYIEHLPNDIQWALKEKYGLRNLGSEQRAMAIHVSEKSVRRACIFMDYMVEKLKELGAQVEVDQYQERRDNTIITWNGVKLYCSLTEVMTTYRNTASTPTGDMTPPYARMPTGRFYFTFFDEKNHDICSFTDEENNRIEDQIQNILSAFRTYVLNQRELIEIKNEEYNKKWEAEREREKARKAAEAAERDRKKLQEKKQEIFRLMSSWEQMHRAKAYVEELSENLETLSPEQQSIINEYCQLVLRLYTVENQYQEILSFMAKG